jgi:hypothetical protein
MDIVRREKILSIYFLFSRELFVQIERINDATIDILNLDVTLFA